MRSLHRRKSIKMFSPIVVLCFLALQATCFLPQNVYADAGDDLKQIEYKYYFRGNYEKAITELRAFLERRDLNKEQIIEAREYLAASLILTGASDQGKAQYLELLKMESTYKGPDPSVFKPIVIATYDEARTEYASTVIRSVPKSDTRPRDASRATPVFEEGKPWYKKWWFYATMGAVLIAVAGAAGSAGDGDSAPPPDTGTVTVEVGIQ